jgi:hypothetical protein
VEGEAIMTSTTAQHEDRDGSAPRFASEQWLWCFLCERFFQGRDARPDHAGAREGCAFVGCSGAGYGVDIHNWDSWPQGDPEALARWPARGALWRGLRAGAWAEDGDGEFGESGESDGAEDDSDRDAAGDNRDGRRDNQVHRGGRDDDDEGDGDEGDEGDGGCEAPWSEDSPRVGFVRSTDVRRRNGLLRIAPGDAEQDEVPFAGLDLVGLATLLREALVAPWDRHAAAPPIVECLTLLARFPELTLAGRVVRSRRRRARWTLAVDYVECELGALSRARRAAVLVALACACADGGVFSRTEARACTRWGAAGSA